LHINTRYIKQDLNVTLPLDRFKEFETEARKMEEADAKN